jgi:hypothetical protein
MVLDINGAKITNGASIIQWPQKTTGNNLNQRWYITQNANGTYTITSALNPAYGIDVNKGSGANGAKLILWSIGTNKPNQQWNIGEITPTLDSTTYVIQTQGTGNRALDIEGNSKANSARMLLWNYHGRANQQFTVRYVPTTGYYTITSVSSGKAIDVSGGSTAQGAQVIQYSLHGRLNQQWSIENNGRGSYSIIGAQSGLSLDVYGGNVANNGRIITWPYHGKYNQQWSFTEVN